MHMMSLSKVIVFLLLISIIVVESRARRKRRQDARSSAYYGSTGLAGYSNILYGLGPYGFGNNLQPIGNNWFVPGIPQNPYNSPFGYNGQQYPYVPSYAYSNAFNVYGDGQYTPPGFNLQYNSNAQAYVGQSYVPSSSEWLPLPGVNRRRQ